MKFDIRNNVDFAELYIYGDVVSDSSQLWSSEDVCPSVIVDQIKELNNKPLNIRISSYGGSVFGGIAIYNVLKSYKGFKTAYIDSCACSIASVIAMCSDKMVMYKNSYLMIHSAWVGGLCGNADDLRQQADLLDKLDTTILNIYKTKLRDDYSAEDLQALIKAETWLKADECVNIFKDIEIVEQEVEAFAKAIESEFVNNYKNIPKEIEEQFVKPIVEEVVDELKENCEEIEEPIVEEIEEPIVEEIVEEVVEQFADEIALAKKELDLLQAKLFLDNYR